MRPFRGPSGFRENPELVVSIKETLKEEYKELLERREKIKQILRNLAEKLRREGILVDDSCRIDMKKFKKYFGEEEVKRDLERVISTMEKFEKGIDNFPPGEKLKELNSRQRGELLEMVKTIVFNEFWGESFIVVRSSFYDDYSNGVDNLLVDRKTGNVICAFDEVVGTRGEAYKGKLNKLQEINRAGAKFKYGFTINPETGKIIYKEISDVPFLCIALDQKTLMEVTKEFRKEELKKLFLFFLLSFKIQIEGLSEQGIQVKKQVGTKLNQFYHIVCSFLPDEKEIRF